MILTRFLDKSDSNELLNFQFKIKNDCSFDLKQQNHQKNHEIESKLKKLINLNFILDNYIPIPVDLNNFIFINSEECSISFQTSMIVVLTNKIIVGLKTFLSQQLKVLINIMIFEI